MVNLLSEEIEEFLYRLRFDIFVLDDPFDVLPHNLSTIVVVLRKYFLDTLIKESKLTSLLLHEAIYITKHFGDKPIFSIKFMYYCVVKRYIGWDKILFVI